MTVTRTARLTGAALCAALALVIVVWVLRDLGRPGPGAELLRSWAGDHGFQPRDRTATSYIDPLLFLAYAATALAAPRSPLAGAAFAVTGLTTLALRLPGLWASGVDELVTTLLTLGLAAALVVTAAAGRGIDGSGFGTPAGPAATPTTSSTGSSTASSAEPGPAAGHAAGAAVRAVAAEETPARPRRGPTLAAAALCAAAALIWAAWEIRWATLLPVEYTVGRFTGGRSLLLPTLAVPPGWLNAVLVLLLLAAAGAAFARAGHARPLGLLAGLLLAGSGSCGVAAALRSDWHTFAPERDLATGLYDLSSAFAVLAGLAVLVLLGLPGRRRVPYRPVAALPPAPPVRRPPGW
ncbi:hypothetical protein ACIGO8_02840 [Streptomyces sp. NPDC053493]|uniref:hypothetical protein n=1 Tax=Streptomyces sp. NPDC053493 TaxID=3365705 RepID=UPI0037D01DC4